MSHYIPGVFIVLLLVLLYTCDKRSFCKEIRDGFFDIISHVLNKILNFSYINIKYKFVSVHATKEYRKVIYNSTYS